MSARELLKRALLLERRFGSVDDEFDVDWERLSEEEKAVVVAAARVELKYRKHGAYGVIFDFTEASAEEKVLRIHAQGIMEKHLEKKSVIKKRREHPIH